ncbi:MAG: hypothetical protein RL637_1853 [Pseudomonadota bacterium]|jgi:cytochrome c-type biogenesis protein CcmH
MNSIFLSIVQYLSKSFIKIKINYFFLLLIFLFSIPVLAAIDTYQFSDNETQQRFQKLTHELRCPKCQNQNLADSNAEIAADLREKIHFMLEQHQSDQQIIEYMLARYGDFVLYQPRFSAKTMWLWLVPFLLLLTGAIVIMAFIRWRIKTTHSESLTKELSIEQQQKLHTLLTDTVEKHK